MLTFYKLLEEIKAKGVEEIQPLLNIGHNPTIGDMYEGLLSKILNKVFEPLENLSVVSGFIIDVDGQYSKQLDCIVVDKIDKYIPNTNKVLVKPENVIAVIEVKKDFFSKDLVKGVGNLLSVVKMNFPFSNLTGIAARNAFENITGRIDENFDLIKANEDLSFYSQLKYNLLMEETYPLRVIFGYEGLKSEFSLREKFLDFLEKNQDNDSIGIISLPNLIVCGEYTLIKANGMPFTMATHSEITNIFPFYASYKKNSLKIFIEMLLTRIANRFNLDIDLLHDPTEERISPLLLAIWSDEKKCWLITNTQIEESSLLQREEEVVVERYIITEEQWVFMSLLSMNSRVPTTIDLLKGKDIKIFLKVFIDHRFVVISDEFVEVNNAYMLSAGRDEFYIQKINE